MLRRVVAISLIPATLSLSITACHTLAPVPLDQLGGIKPARVWVTRADRSVVVVSGPQTFGDTLVGYVNGNYEEMPAADFKQVLMRTPARGKTALLITAGTLGLAGFAYLLTGVGKSDSGNASVDCDDDPSQPGCP